MYPIYMPYAGEGLGRLKFTLNMDGSQALIIPGYADQSPGYRFHLFSISDSSYIILKCNTKIFSLVLVRLA